MQAIRSARPGGHVGYVGVAHDVELPGRELFFSHVRLHAGPAPVRRFLPELIDLIWNRQIDPGQVFDLTLPRARPPRATARWTNAPPSRPCCAPLPSARPAGRPASRGAAAGGRPRPQVPRPPGDQPGWTASAAASRTPEPPGWLSP